MRKLFCAVLILSVLLVTQIPGYAQRPAVDGFIGVPWGASKVQVQAAMAKKGFTLIEHRGDVIDKYQGTFAGHPAELLFYFEKNVFYCGMAALLDAQGTNDLDRTIMIYREMLQVLVAKYGRPDTSGTGNKSSNQVVSEYSSWDNIPTTATPPGKVYMNIQGGAVGGLNVEVMYSIGKGWALLKTGNGNDY